jgi:hypothetical protein
MGLQSPGVNGVHRETVRSRPDYYVNTARTIPDLVLHEGHKGDANRDRQLGDLLAFRG